MARLLTSFSQPDPFMRGATRGLSLRKVFVSLLLQKPDGYFHYRQRRGAGIHN